MKWILYSFLTVNWMFPLATFAKDDCACEVIECPECYKKTEKLDFYKEKCDGGKRIKSCSKPRCEMILPLSPECDAKINPKPLASPTPIAVAPQKTAASNPSSTRKVIGTLLLSVGDSWISSPSAPDKREAQTGEKVSTEDTLETGEKGRMKVIFVDQNVLTVIPNSRVQLSEYEAQADSAKKAVTLNLLYGTIRNMVKEKYQDNDKSYYRVRTPATVAGVRGTDFVTTYDPKNKESRTDTFGGVVDFGPTDKVKTISIGRSESAIFIADDKPQALLAEKGYDFVGSGHLSPIKKLTASEIDELQKRTNWSAKEAMALSQKNQVRSNICHNPTAQFNQCLWQCVNNPKGAKTCRVELPKVWCERKRCNANGTWAESTKIQSNDFGPCAGDKVIINACDY